MSVTNNTKQTLWLSISSLASTLIGLISPMILSRYWSKMDYGTFKQVMYVYNTLIFVFTVGLPKSFSYFIPRVPESEVKNLVSKINFVFFLLGSIFSLFLFGCSDIIAELLKNDQLSGALRLFSIVPFLMLPTMGIESIFSVYRQTHIYAIYVLITRSLILLCTVLPVILFNGNYLDSITGFVIASFITCILGMALKTYPLPKNVSQTKSHISYKDLFHFAFPLFSASIWSFVITSTDQFFISRYFGTETFAEFSNGYIEVPFVSMIVASVGTVLLPLFSQFQSRHDVISVYSLWKSSMHKTIKIIYPIVVFFLVFSTLIMRVLYGEQYVNSGFYFMCKNICCLFSIVPFQVVILALGKTKEYSNIHMISAIMIVVAEFLCVKLFHSPYPIIIASILCFFIKFIMQMHLVANSLQIRLKVLLPMRFMLRYFSIALLSGICTYFFIAILKYNNAFLNCILAFIVYVLTYYIFSFIFNLHYKDLFVSIFPTNKFFRAILKIIP